MQADFKIVLDACVLANIAVCDLFLRLAEKPRLFLMTLYSMFPEVVVLKLNTSIAAFVLRIGFRFASWGCIVVMSAYGNGCRRV